jgi:hypothetical protein
VVCQEGDWLILCFFKLALRIGGGQDRVNHNLQSSCARLLSSENRLLERTKFTRRLGSRRGYRIRRIDHCCEPTGDCID